jgi:hypothetical protein
VKKLETVSGEVLMSEPLAPLKFIADRLLPEGLFILAGSPKVGKSWLALQLCLAVSKGESFLNCKTEKSGVLYLCLEDSYQRIQSRLFDITEDAPPTIHFTNLAHSIGEGLEEEIAKFVSTHFDTRLVVIDTLQMIRSGNVESSYGNDYKELSSLHRLAQYFHITLLLIHHLRKAKSADPQERISGTTGISGCADGSFVLLKKKRGENFAVLSVTGRDIEEREIELEFSSDTHTWSCCSQSEEKPADNFLEVVVNFVRERKYFSGTAAQLLEILQDRLSRKFVPNTLSKALIQNSIVLKQQDVIYSTRKSSGTRLIELTENRVDTFQN